jgi:hypothetical protein
VTATAIVPEIIVHDPAFDWEQYYLEYPEEDLPPGGYSSSEKSSCSDALFSDEEECIDLESFDYEEACRKLEEAAALAARPDDYCPGCPECEHHEGYHWMHRDPTATTRLTKRTGGASSALSLLTVVMCIGEVQSANFITEVAAKQTQFVRYLIIGFCVLAIVKLLRHLMRKRSLPTAAPTKASDASQARGIRYPLDPLSAVVGMVVRLVYSSIKGMIHGMIGRVQLAAVTIDNFMLHVRERKKPVYLRAYYVSTTVASMMVGASLLFSGAPWSWCATATFSVSILAMMAARGDRPHGMPGSRSLYTLQFLLLVGWGLGAIPTSAMLAPAPAWFLYTAMAVSIARGVKNPLGFGLIALVVMLMAGSLPTAFIDCPTEAPITVMANPIVPPTTAASESFQLAMAYYPSPTSGVIRQLQVPTAQDMSLVCAAVSFVKDGRPTVGLPGCQVQVPAALRAKLATEGVTPQPGCTTVVLAIAISPLSSPTSIHGPATQLRR